jgi:hypothetical protein
MANVGALNELPLGIKAMMMPQEMYFGVCSIHYVTSQRLWLCSNNFRKRESKENMAINCCLTEQVMKL